ncbi:MAG TPA: aminotransferase class V-fold PLP-dependent enzyme [Bryobacteraceae bacterium]|jgi:glutamate/tyrosine decarboxylase-like PLP-dependent enzyme|nr:aminotransferase class V-fold PLP-dependent enzyme [Bryobacteraceae bacterium]
MLLQKTHDLAVRFLDSLATRPVTRSVDFGRLVECAGGPLPAMGEEPDRIIEKLAGSMDAGLVATAGPRYFGFVIGGALPAALAADWLASAWDQNGFCFATSPAAAAVEEISARWLIELFGLRRSSSVGFTSGCTMANFTGLAAARHALYRQLGCDVERQGLIGAPPVTVVTSEESHVSIFAALQMLGLGRERVVKVAADDQGRMRADALRLALAEIHTPVVVCAQAGNVNTGAFDPLLEIAACVHARDGWLHVDGAFGLWAAASPAHRELTRGIDLADSIAVDCHKWLNVPYDSGLVFVRDRAAHYAAMSLSAPYYAPPVEMTRDNHNWTPEASRRARGFAVYAALRSLGREGIAGMIERNCALARRMAERLSKAQGVEILNDVVLNQLLVRLDGRNGKDADAFTAEVIRRVQEDGTCWLGGTTWHGMHCMRISVSNWSTSEGDIDVSAEAILRCAASD